MHGFGFIGFGNMAKVIIGGLVNYAGIDPRSVYVTRGDKSRLGEVADAFKGVNTVETCADVTENAKIIFLCVKPAEMKNVIAEISAAANEETHIVSLSVVISMEDLEKLFNGKVTK